MNGLLGFIITAIFGFGITFLFDINFRKLERFALSILLGFGVQTLFMFIFYLFGLGFTLMNTLLEMFILSTPIYLLCIFLGRWPKIKNFWLTIFSFRNLKKELVTIVSSNPEEKIFIIFVLGLLLVSLIIGTYFPVSGWDSLVLYDFRAVTFVATGGMADGIARGYFFGYPLMTSLAHTWMYFVKGNPHVFYWGIYLAFIVVIYECLKSFLGSVTTKITTLVLITLPFVFTGSYFDYTNFPYLVYIVTSVLYIIRFSKDRKSGYLILASILVGLSTWIRETEPFWIVNLLAIITVIIPGYRKRFVFNTFLIALCLFVFFAIQQPWKLYETKMIGGGRNVGDQAAYAIKSLEIFDIPRFIDVAITTIKGTVSTWSPYLSIAVLAAILARKNLKKGIIIIGFVLGDIGLLFVGTYIFSFIWKESWKSIIESQQRLSTFIIPLLIVFIATMFDDYIIKGEIFLREWIGSFLHKTFDD